MNAPVRIPADIFEDERIATEAGMLGALLVYGDPALYRVAAAIVQPQHFHEHLNARIFQAIGRGVDAGLRGFRVTQYVLGELRDDATITELKTTPTALVARYGAMAYPSIGVEGAARQIRHDRLAIDLKQAAEEGDTATAETIAAEMERLSRAHLNNENQTEPLGAAALKAIQTMSDAYQAGGSRHLHADTGFADLTRQLGGWKRGRFYVIAGRPGMGKSTWSLAAMLRTAQAGHGVAFFALEMSKDEISTMALCNLAWSRESRIEYRDVAPEASHLPGYDQKFDRVYAVQPKLEALPLFLTDRAGLTVANIRAEAHNMAQRLVARGKKLEIICIDHMGLIKPETTYQGNKVAETEQISAALKVLAKELDVAVIALSQLSRQVEGRNDKRPNLSDLRWSGAIEQDADVVMFVYREAYYLSKKEEDSEKDLVRQSRLAACRNKIEVLVEKNRGGPTGSIEFYCDIACAVVRSAE